MCLKLNASLSSGQLADQTPTPSRFLGNFVQQWEAVGLPSDISEIAEITEVNTGGNTNSSAKSSNASNNPFAASFQKALVERQNSVSKDNLLKMPSFKSGITDSPLNTPSIIPNNESASPIYSNNEGLLAIVNAALNTPDNFNYAGSNVTASKTNISSNGNDVSNQDCNLKKSFQAVPVIKCSTITNAAQIPIILANNTNIKSTDTIKIKPIKGTTIIAPKINKDAGSNALYKVILKLPDGRSVQLPVASTTPATPITSISSIKNVNEILNDASKLEKHQVQTNKLSNLSSSSSLVSQMSSSSSSSPSSVNLPYKDKSSSLQSRVDALSATLASLPPKAKPGRKSKFAPEEDPVEKKVRSLERNRAAAMRCRLKRKQWVDSLEDKADEMEKTNERLQV